MCRYNVIRIALDNYRYALLRKALIDIGIEYDKKKKMDEQTLQLVRPSDKEKIEPIIDSLLRNKKVIWGDCMTMRWCANNTKRAKVKLTGNYQYQKIDAKSRKTDAFMAFVHAMTQNEHIPEDENNDIKLETFVM
jgi:phage terminase large subunit-like protein